MNKKTGRVYYHVHYERVLKYDEKAKSWGTPVWQKVSGDLVTKLPAVFTKDKLFAGYEDKAVMKPVYFKDKLPKWNVDPVK